MSPWLPAFRLAILSTLCASTIFFLRRDGSSRFSPMPASLPTTDYSSHSEKPSVHLPNFQRGVAKPAGSNYSRVLIVPHQKHEDVSWIDAELPDLETAMYVVDDMTAPLHPPKNKGHEVMVYLSYIIEHYDELPEILIFMHAHRFAWHNEEPLNFDAVQVLHRLSSERVTREGFMNLRCNWNPGCPDWMHPHDASDDFNKQEEALLAGSWTELFPLDPVPEVLAQPCCAQFALSRARVRSIPRARYIFYRDWLLRTELTDFISGRVWEYLWHYVFTGQSVFCPEQHACFCDGYGLCFGGPRGFDQFMGLVYQTRDQQTELRMWRDQMQAIVNAQNDADDEALARLEVPAAGRDIWLEGELDRKYRELEVMRAQALERGADPKNRATEAGRPWREGDGF